MKILIRIGHPGHVHLFKNTINNLERNGHIIKIVTRDKDVNLKLLDAYKFTYKVISGHYNTLLGKAYDFVKTDLKLLKLTLKIKPDLLIGIGDPCVAQIGKLIGKSSIVFTDTEDAKLSNFLTFPFASTVCTPACYKDDLGPNHVRYNGYHELAYLHPNYFQPDPSVLDDLNLSKDDEFIVLRFISWAATHDVNLKGVQEVSNLVKSLKDYGEIFITSERKLNPELEKYRITCSPEKIHSLLYYSQLYIGEGGTMAAEAAILGTPAIHIESTSKGIATGELSGNFLELQNKYGLLYFYPDQNQALKKAISILEDKNAKNEWQKKREKLLKDKIDVTAWMTNFIERYPESFYEYREQRGTEEAKK